MNAYEIGIKLALEDCGLEKLAQGFQSISQMKDQAYRKQRMQGPMAGASNRASEPARPVVPNRPAPQRAAAPAPAPAQPAAPAGPGMGSRIFGPSQAAMRAATQRRPPRETAAWAFNQSM